LGITEGVATITAGSGSADAAAAGITGIFLRQGTAANAPAGILDAIRVAYNMGFSYSCINANHYINFTNVC